MFFLVPFSSILSLTKKIDNFIHVFIKNGFEKDSFDWYRSFTLKTFCERRICGANGSDSEHYVRMSILFKKCFNVEKWLIPLFLLIYTLNLSQKNSNGNINNLRCVFNVSSMNKYASLPY